MLQDTLGCADTEPNRWASRFLVLGAVQRTFEPGAKLDTMPVLVGDQGIGKSSLLPRLLPDGYPEFFSDSLNLSDRTKERAEALLGRVIVEAGEMSGVNRAELQSLKSFITRQDDGTVRLAYARRPRTLLRRCIIVGTADRAHCLPNDPAGLRRFLPVQCRKGSNIEAYMEANRKQLWAEGLHRYRQGERAGVPRNLLAEQAEVAERHRSPDVLLEDAINQLDPAPGEVFKLAEIAEKIGLTGRDGKAITLSQADTNRLSAALRNAGWDTKQYNRKERSGRYWHPPENRDRTTPTDCTG